VPPLKKPTTAILREAFDDIAEHAKHLQLALGTASFHASPTQLNGFLSKLASNIKAAAKVYRRQDLIVRPKIRAKYRDMLEVLLIVVHDIAAHFVTVEINQSAKHVFLESYREVLITWLGASPDVSHNQYRDPLALLRNFRHNPRIPLTPGTVLTPVSLPTKVRTLFDADVARVTSGKMKPRAGELILRNDTRYALGHAFLIMQLNLAARGEFVFYRTSVIKDWYKGTRIFVDALFETADLFGAFERQALKKGKLKEANLFREQGKLFLQTLAEIYSVKQLAVPVLYTVFTKQHLLGDRFSFSDLAIGANGRNEEINTYFGNPNPDAQADRDTESVDFILLRPNTHDGKEIAVIGVLRKSGNRVYSMVALNKYIAFEPKPDATSEFISILRAKPIDRAVVVRGVFDKSQPVIRDASVQRHFHFYDALCSVPLRVGLGNNQRYKPLQPWRRVSATLAKYAQEEMEQKSIPNVLIGQQRLAADAHRIIFKTRTGGIRKAKKIDSLDPRTQRLAAWSFVFARAKRTAKSGQNSTQQLLKTLFEYINRYLAAYTRHTYLNIRDEGKNYVASDWPRGLADQDFYDCGVYATVQAYEISRVLANAQPALKIQYQFVTFLNHICVVGFVDNQYSFMVNNDRVYGPIKIKQLNSARATRLEVARQWAERAYSTVYNIRYAVMIVVLPDFMVNANASDQVVSNRLWSAYQKSIAWALQNEIVIFYHVGIKRFSQRSDWLDKLMDRAKKMTKSSKWDTLVDDISDLALKMYDLADLLTDSCNLGYISKHRKKKANVKLIPLAGAIDTTRARPQNLNTLLPMYRAHDVAKLKKTRALPSQLLKKDRGKAHGAKLTTQIGVGCTNEQVPQLTARWQLFLVELNKADGKYQRWIKQN